MIEALRRAAEDLVGRSITQSELNELVERFRRADGTYRERAREALRGFIGLTEAQIRTKTAASDNTDRILNDLQQTLDDWEPGS